MDNRKFQITIIALLVFQTLIALAVWFDVHRFTSPQIADLQAQAEIRDAAEREHQENVKALLDRSAKPNNSP